MLKEFGSAPDEPDYTHIGFVVATPPSGSREENFLSYKVSQLHSLEMCDDIWRHALKSASEQVTPHLHVCLTHAHAPPSEHDIPPVDRCRLHIAVDTL